MTTVKERNTYFLTDTLNGAGGVLYKNFNLNDADELRVVQIIYVGADADATFRISWNGVAECFALFDVGNSSGNLNVRHNIHGKTIQGRQTFTIYDHLGAIKTNLTGTIGFIFEAIKY